MSDPIKVVSIGAGDLAHHLIPGLHRIGCEIVQVYSRTMDSAKRLSIKVNSKPTTDLSQLSSAAELYILMVKDDVIKDIVHKMETLNANQILVHTSGATPSLKLGKKADNYGSFYPLQTFKRSHPVDLEKVPFLIFGNNADTTRRLRMIARQLSPSVSEVNDTDRLRYHLSAVMLNNFSNHLACMTQEFLETNELDMKVLEPIMKTSYEKILVKDPCGSQTGPAVRNDQRVIKSHLKLLEEDPYLSAIYKSMTQSITSKAQKNENS